MAFVFRAPYIAPQYTREWRVESSYGTPPVMLQLLIAAPLLPPGAQLYDRPPDPPVYDLGAIHWQNWLIIGMATPPMPPGAQLFDRPLSQPM